MTSAPVGEDAARTDSPRLMVVGAGPAGLTAALLAARRGWKVTVVESADRAGGMSASIVVSGQRVDLGSHRLHPAASDRSMALLRELLGADLQTRPRNGRIRLEGRWLPFPLTASAMALNLAPSTAARSTLDALTSPLRSARSDTFAEVVRAGLGPTVLRIFYGPYAPKLWGRQAEELAGELARRRISVSSPAALIGKLYRAARRGPLPFLYPRLGYGQIVDRLVESCHHEGVDIELGRSVTAIEHREDGTLAIGRDADDTVVVDRVFWTASPVPLLRATGDVAPVIEPPPRAMVLVYLTLEVDRYTSFDAHYFPERHVVMTRLSEPKNYRDGPDPSGRTVLCAEIACDIGDETWESGAPELAARVVDSIAVAGLPPVDVVETHLERLPSVYPVMTPQNVAAFDELVEQASSVEGVTLLGRQGLLVADNLHHVIDMAFEAAESLVSDGSWDERRWSEALAGFADHVVED